ncbi:MAG: GIY-YIG nuclease family protein [Promethearchaeota archaeon]|nr:MAG: GIY-YIG nuclease family protein [Candidatus Lokiarchaeota archaeon]
MISLKQSSEIIFDEFSSFLKNSGILYHNSNIDKLDDFKIISKLFKDKIRRCEVIKLLIFPYQIYEACNLFKKISKEIQQFIMRQDSFIKFREMIIDKIISDKKFCKKNEHPIDILFKNIFNVLYSKLIKDGIKGIISFDVSSQICKSCLNNNFYNYTDEIILGLCQIFHCIFNDLIKEENISKKNFVNKAVERLGETNLISQIYTWELLTNLSFNCINFLTENRYIYFKKGNVINLDGELRNGLKKFKNEIYSLINSLPGKLREDLTKFTENIVEQLSKVLKQDVIGRYYSIESAISLVVEIVYKKSKSTFETIKIKNLMPKIIESNILGIKYENLGSKGYGYIYIIINRINGKVYIGQTRQNPRIRWIHHKSAAKVGEINPLYNSIRYHGIKNFSFHVVEKVSIELLNQKEIEYIKEYKSNIREYGPNYGYNLTAGGLGGKLKYIEKSLLENLIIQGLKLEQICEELEVSKQALYTRLYQLWEGNLREVRNHLMNSKIKNLIILGYDIIQIAEELNMSRAYIYIRLKEIWNVTSIYEARLRFRKSIIKNLLKKGTMLEEIADKLGISRYTAAGYIEKYWGMNYTDAKHHFMKPYIKSLIEKGLSEYDITEELNIVRYETVNQYINDYWGMNYLTVRNLFFIKPLLKSMIIDGYTRIEIANEFSVRPETINEYAKKFWNNTFTNIRHKLYTEILLKTLISQGLSVIEIAKKLRKDPKSIYSYIQKFWNITYEEARYTFKSKN